MSEPRRHHYIPRSYLEGWYDREGFLSCYQWATDKLICRRLSSKSTAFKRDLYALEHTPEEYRQAHEKYVNQAVDSDGALVLAKFRSGVGVDQLTAAERLSWSRFVISLPLRNPEALLDITLSSQKSTLERTRADYTEQFPDPGSEEEFERTFAEVLREDPEVAWLHSNHGLVVLAGILLDPQYAASVSALNWWTLDLSGSRFRLLTSDRPYVLFGMAQERRIGYVPVSPSLGFFSSPDPLKPQQFRAAMSREGPTRLAGFLNSLVAGYGERYVYGIDCKQARFVEKRLKR
jgi:hypothetical protein